MTLNFSELFDLPDGFPYFRFMNGQVAQGVWRGLNKSVIAGYIIVLVLALALLFGYLVLTERYLTILALLAVLTAIVIITQPRWALYQYVFCLFVTVAIDQEIPVFLADISALVVIAAAVLDIFMSDRLPRRFPRLFFNFVFLLTAVSIAAFFAYNPAASLNPIARITFLTVTFLALYHLAGKAEIGNLVRFFFWMCVVHSMIVVVPFIASAGEVRSFGLTGKAYDDLAMITLPVGIALFLWSKPGRTSKYLFGSLLVLGSLVATQSRASMVFAVFASTVVLVLSLVRWLAVKRYSQSEISNGNEVSPPVGKRAVLLCLSVILLGAITVSLMPEAYHYVASRFESALALAPTGTAQRRLELWRSALTAFFHHPVLGVGPGNFRMLREILPTLHLHPLQLYVRGLSAHNLFLHYLAETGLLGATALMALFVNQFRISRWTWRQELPLCQIGSSLALYVAGLMFLVTTLLEAGWIWGQFGFPFVFFAALIVRNQQSKSNRQEARD